ncbi:ribosomal protein S11, plastid (mitochondrion) [Artemisia annua]|uniref:Ribosomal protein S11, plastid n=1 Tax=Artemisia annua TaxID=35608 RepID=A0A2U1NJ83_ARTAN|nr:ribosomal protein S11, plastid [Artemisia annua]
MAQESTGSEQTRGAVDLGVLNQRRGRGSERREAYSIPGTPFAAQTAAANAIRAVVDQGMQRAEVMIKGPGLGRDAGRKLLHSRQ